MCFAYAPLGHVGFSHEREHRGTNKPLAGDDVIGVLIFIVLSSQVWGLLSLLEYPSTAHSSEALAGELGY